MKKLWSVFKTAAVEQNAVLVQFLGVCPALAVVTTAKNALFLGIAVTVVLLFSGLVVSLLRKFIPPSIRIVSYLVFLSSFVTVLKLLTEAYFPAVQASLGMFFPLIIVNCLLLGRAEAFASQNSPLPSLADGLGTGVGYTLVLTVAGAIRELLGSGTLLGGTALEWKIPAFEPISVFLLPAGALFVLGFLAAGVNALRSHLEEKGRRKEKK